MKRGDLYLVPHGSKYDPKKRRAMLVVSRNDIFDTSFPFVMCAPILTKYEGLMSQVELGVEHGLKHDCAVHCDNLYSLPKTLLTNYISTLPASKMEEVNEALRFALSV